MLGLRPYKKSDASYIISWLNSEEIFSLWGGERFGRYPIDSEIINDKYFNNNGDCAEEDNFYPLIAFDENGPVGHFIIRYINGDKHMLRFGWVIVDDKRRGQKIGQEMLTTGLNYAFNILKGDKVTIGVFENNIPALNCYLSCGFHKSEDLQDSVCKFNGEDIKVIELEILKSEFEDKASRETKGHY